MFFFTTKPVSAPNPPMKNPYNVMNVVITTVDPGAISPDDAGGAVGFQSRIPMPTSTAKTQAAINPKVADLAAHM
jgi:hypothetical protein